MQNGRSSVTEAVGYELSITRVFDAPRALVWKAWTDPKMAGQWMGPRGFKTTVFETSSEPGGKWKLFMEGHVPAIDQVVKLKQGGTVKEFRPPELLSYTFAWDDRSSVGLGESPYKANLVTIRLEEHGSKTIMRFTQTPFATEGERDGHTVGWNSAFDCLAEFVREHQPERAASADDLPSELHLKRFFAAPREMVFAAWTEPEVVAQWLGPREFINTVHAWEARSGGAIKMYMKGPNGVEHPTTGQFFEVYPPFQLHFTAAALDYEGNKIFENWNSVTFTEVEGGTEVVLDVHVMRSTEGAGNFLRGMEAGWGQGLDKLDAYLKKP